MLKKKLPKSLRKYIRKEKTRIRQEVFDLKEQEKLIGEIHERFLKKSEKIEIKKNKKEKTG